MRKMNYRVKKNDKNLISEGSSRLNFKKDIEIDF